MIAKHIPMEAVKKSSFVGLVKYLTGPQGKQERVGDVCVTNCHSERAEIAALEVLNTQTQNKRAEADKTYHLMISFRAGEHPGAKTLRAIEERLCKALGFADHQRVSVVHHDTDNLHVHVAINMIHPTRYTVHRPYWDYRILPKMCDKLEDQFGLQKDNHTPRKSGAESRAADMERHADVESLLGWVKRECKGQLQGAGTWDQLHAALAENGLHLQLRANGFVIAAENGVSVKASSVGREFSKARLEQRLGPFRPAPQQDAAVQPARRYEKKPFKGRVDTTELYARYQAAQEAAKASRAADWDKAMARKRQRIEAAKRTGRLKRAVIRVAKVPRAARKLMYAAVSKSLLDSITAINKSYKKERQEIHERHRQLQWADWLREQAEAGDLDALAALRGREAARGLTGNTVGGWGGSRGAVPLAGHDSVTKKGTVIHRTGAAIVRDDGDKLKVAAGADRVALQTALCMAIARYGNRLTVNGSHYFKQRIVRAAAAARLDVSFDDPALEQRRQQLTNPSPPTKERKHDHSHHVGQRSYRRGDEQTKRAAAASRAAAAQRARRAGAGGSGQAVGAKSHARGARPAPPPVTRHAVRGMPERSVVHVAEGRQVLLPGHVHHGVEQQGAQSDHRVRRDLDRPGRVTAPRAGRSATGKVGKAAPPLLPGHRAERTVVPAAARPNVGSVGTAPPPTSKGRLQRLSQVRSLAQVGALRDGAVSPLPSSTPYVVPEAPMPAATPSVAAPSAAEKYITEREQKRVKGFDIPKHELYTADNAGPALYAGSRCVDGQMLALLKRDDAVMVLEVDDATAQRLKRLPLGAQVGVDAQGVIRKKGRSR